VQAATGSTDAALGGGLASATITVTGVNDAPTTSGLSNVTATQNNTNSTVSLFPGFADLEDSDAAMTYTVTGNTNTALVSSTSVNAATGVLTLNFASGGVGTANITVRATDTGGLYVETTFTLTRQAGYTVSGRIADAQGAAIVGVSVSRGAGSTAATTNSAGYYTLTNVPPGSYTITPTKSNYTFAPATRSVTVTSANVGSQNFTGTTGYTINGRISNSAGAQIAGVSITRSGSATPAVSNSAGYYTFISVQPGTYTLTATKSGYRFTPTTKSVSVTSTNVSGQNFIGATGYNISGRIANSSGVGQANISVKRSGSSTAVVTNSAGYYTFTDVPNGSVTITPGGTGLSFSPESRTVTMNSADISGYNFTVAPGYNVIGRITTSAGAAIVGVTVARSGSTTTAVTNSAGYFVFSGVKAGTYTLTPSLSGYSFTPTTKTVTVVAADVSNQNFIGSSP
jgi:inhibitor of cysteine peptidase